MKKILMSLLLITIKSFLYDNSDDIPQLLKEYETIEPCLSKTYYVKYFQITNLSFKKNINQDKNNSLQVNIHSINCNIEINPQLKGKIINQINFNTYYYN